MYKQEKFSLCCIPNNNFLYKLALLFLVASIWLQYLFQAVLNIVGGLITWTLVFIAAGLCFVSSKNKGIIIDKYLAIRIIFYSLYFLLFIIGSLESPSLFIYDRVFVFELPKQIHSLLINIIILETFIHIYFNISDLDKRWVEKFLLSIFISVALFNIVAVLRNPDNIKASVDDGSVFVLGYSMSYVLAILTPLCIYKILNKEKWWFAYLALLSISAISVFMSGYFIATITMILSILFYFISTRKNRTIIFVLVGLLLLLSAILLNSSTIVDTLDWLSDRIPIYQISERLSQLSSMFKNGIESIDKNMTTYRFYLYFETWSHFLDHPLFGGFIFGNYSCFYDHATLIDYLSIGGVLLGGLYLGYVFGFYKKYSQLKDEKYNNTLLAVYLSYVFLSLCNSVFSYRLLGILFFAAPVMLDGKYEKNSNYSSL